VYTTLEVPEELDFAAEEIGDRTASFALPPGLVRLSIGVESQADIERDVQRGLDAVEEGTGRAPHLPGA
jgi:cystathionine beta-lyase/cystathionine gamma-synthase